MGSVIGKGGSKIKEIQEASGSRLNASEAMLPGSTEVCWVCGHRAETDRSASCPSPVSLMPSTLPSTTSVPSFSSTKNETRAPLPGHTANRVPAVDRAAEAVASTAPHLQAGWAEVEVRAQDRVRTPKHSKSTSQTPSSVPVSEPLPTPRPP